MQVDTPTPMISQYLEVKSRYPDSILFYRMGDFYEMFFDDALTAAPLLEVQLTSRSKSNPIPMCGIPYHAAQSYIQKLISRGHRVAVCEQQEDPATAKGLVKRDVVRVITPALVADPDLVAPHSRRVLAVVARIPTGGFLVALVDLLASSVRSGEVPSIEELEDLIKLEAPQEFLLPENFDRQSIERLAAICPSALITTRDYFTKGGDTALRAASRYLAETQKIDADQFFGEVLPLEPNKSLSIDSVSIASLEILSPIYRSGRSLFDTIDRTLTAMGRRLLQDRLRHPSTDGELISFRWDCVGAFFEHEANAIQIRNQLRHMRDLERLNAKTALGLALPRDLGAIRDCLQAIPTLRRQLEGFGSKALATLAMSLEPLRDLHDQLDSLSESDLPLTPLDGGIFKSGVDAEIDRLRSLTQDAKELLAQIELRERHRTGIASLKLKFSKVFGYTIEITNSNLNRVPPEYIRKQTIAGGERFITEELKDFEVQLFSAEQSLKQLSQERFIKLRSAVSEHTEALARNARALAEIDVLQSFAVVARQNNYVRPSICESSDLEIVGGRHPVVETVLKQESFIPNSIHMTPERRTWIITGPNMGGKSTVMRQVALTCLLAQAGSFVPARSARLPILDAIYTRIGSSDDLSTGRSTFMVEMTEIARILKTATSSSLILIDEIGRGTSTYDGLALAWSLLEHIHNDLTAKILFATHFHELTALAQKLPGVYNAAVAVSSWENQIVFQYRLTEGAADQSYGIEVAKLAGLPAHVIERARKVLHSLESGAAYRSDNPVV